MAPDKDRGRPTTKGGPSTAVSPARLDEGIVPHAMDGTRWRLRGRRLCPRRRPWFYAAIAELSATLGSLEAAYRQADTGRLQREAAARALAARRKRDFDAGLLALDGHLHRDTAFRRFVAERLGLPAPAEAWPEPEVGG